MSLVGPREHPTFPGNVRLAPKLTSLESSLTNPIRIGSACHSSWSPWDIAWRGMFPEVPWAPLSSYGLVLQSREPWGTPSVMPSCGNHWREAKTKQHGPLLYQSHPSWVQLGYSLQSRFYPRHSLQSGDCLRHSQHSWVSWSPLSGLGLPTPFWEVLPFSESSSQHLGKPDA